MEIEHLWICCNKGVKNVGDSKTSFIKSSDKFHQIISTVYIEHQFMERPVSHLLYYCVSKRKLIQLTYIQYLWCWKRNLRGKPFALIRLFNLHFRARVRFNLHLYTGMQVIKAQYLLSTLHLQTDIIHRLGLLNRQLTSYNNTAQHNTSLCIAVSLKPSSYVGTYIAEQSFALF